VKRTHEVTKAETLLVDLSGWETTSGRAFHHQQNEYEFNM
jgi:hypothetical protein